MKKLLALSLFLLSFDSFASSGQTVSLGQPATRWRDPNDILMAVDNFVGWKPFDMTFQTGDSVEYTRSDCDSKGSCTKTSAKQVVEFKSNRVYLVDYDQTGAQLKRKNIAEDTWNMWAGNMVRGALFDLEDRGLQAELMSLITEKTDIQYNGQLTTVEIQKVLIKSTDFQGHITETEMTVAKDFRGFAQLLMRKDAHLDTGDSTVFEVTSITQN